MNIWTIPSMIEKVLWLPHILTIPLLHWLFPFDQFIRTTAGDIRGEPRSLHCLVKSSGLAATNTIWPYYTVLCNCRLWDGVADYLQLWDPGRGVPGSHVSRGLQGDVPGRPGLCSRGYLHAVPVLLLQTHRQQSGLQRVLRQPQCPGAQAFDEMWR